MLKCVAMKILIVFIVILKVIFIPCKLVSYFLYERRPRVVGCSWYSRKQYRLIVEKRSLDYPLSFDEWESRSKKMFETMINKGFVVVRVEMNDKKVLEWLKKNNLTNTNENREKYLSYRVQSFLENPRI